MEGSRQLGMIAPGPGRTVAPVGAECEITECQPLPDGCAFAACPPFLCLRCCACSCLSFWLLGFRFDWMAADALTMHE